MFDNLLKNMMMTITTTTKSNYFLGGIAIIILYLFDEVNAIFKEDVGVLDFSLHESRR